MFESFVLCSIESLILPTLCFWQPVNILNSEWVRVADLFKGVRSPLPQVSFCHLRDRYVGLYRGKMSIAEHLKWGLNTTRENETWCHTILVMKRWDKPVTENAVNLQAKFEHVFHVCGVWLATYIIYIYMYVFLFVFEGSSCIVEFRVVTLPANFSP